MWPVSGMSPGEILSMGTPSGKPVQSERVWRHWLVSRKPDGAFACEDVTGKYPRDFRDMDAVIVMADDELAAVARAVRAMGMKGE